MNNLIQDSYFRVEVVNSTPDPNYTCWVGMHQDYAEDAAIDSKILNNPDKYDEQWFGEKVIKHCLEHGHFGPLEHPALTVNAIGFGHSVMQQLRTHRLLTFDVQCLAADSLITVSNGRFGGYSKKLEDIWRSWNDLDNKRVKTFMRNHTKLKCFDELNKKWIWTSIKDVFDGGIKELYEVKLENGRSVKCSMEHKLLTLRGWQPLKSVGEGDSLVSYKALYHNKKKGFEVPFSQEELDNEVWKSINNIGNYAISNLGRVKNLTTNSFKKPSLGKNGYRVISLWEKSKEAKVYVHTAVLEGFDKPFPGKGFECRHLDSNPLNNRLSNLKWGTLKENKADMLKISPPQDEYWEYSKIVSVTSLGDQQCYDIEVEGPYHNFLADNVVVHNSMRYSGMRIARLGETLSGNATYKEDERRIIENVFYLRPVGQYVDRQGAHYNYDELWRLDDIKVCRDAAIKYWRDTSRGMSEEHARGTLPFDFRQNFVVSFNMRALMHLIAVRGLADTQIETQTFIRFVMDRFVQWSPVIGSWFEKKHYGKNKLAP